MTALWWTMTRAGGWGRMLLVIACTGIVSGLALVAWAIAELPSHPHERLLGAVSDPGTRGGTVLAIALCGVPPLLLLYQGLRLGTMARERRLAALRLAGATPRQVQWIGAAEVGVPALVGGVVGVGIYWLCRWLVGGEAAWHAQPYRLRLVPTSVMPSGGAIVSVVLGIAVAGSVVGIAAGRGVTISPLGVVRGRRQRPPRPWGIAPIALGLVLGLVYLWWFDDLGRMAAQAVGALATALMVLGVIGLAAWAAHAAGRFAAARAASAPLLWASRRLVVEPRPAAWAAAAVGGIGLVAGGAGALAADLLSVQGSADEDHVVALVVAALCLPVALVVVIGSLAVHASETLLEHGRSAATLTAQGAPLGLFAQAQRWEAYLVALPMAALGVLLGGGALGVVVREADPLVLVGCLAVVLLLMEMLVWLAVEAAVRLIRPLTSAAVDVGNLRAE